MLALIFVASAAAAALYVHVQAGRDAKREAERSTRFAARTAAEQLGDDLAAIRATVAGLAANPQIEQTLSHPAGCSLTFGPGGAIGSGHIEILRADGSVACSSRARTGGRALPGYVGEDWVRRARRGKVFLAPVVDAGTHRPVVLVAAPAGRAIVASFADLTPLGSHLVLLYGGDHPVEFLVTSGDGRKVVARSIDPRRWIGASLAGTAFARASGKVERRDVDGTTRFYEEVAVPGVGWRF